MLGCFGPRLTLSTACSSSAQALGIAADWIHCGRAERVLSGGVDALCLMTYSGFDALRALDRGGTGDALPWLTGGLAAVGVAFLISLLKMGLWPWLQGSLGRLNIQLGGMPDG